MLLKLIGTQLVEPALEVVDQNVSDDDLLKMVNRAIACKMIRSGGYQLVLQNKAFLAQRYDEYTQCIKRCLVLDIDRHAVEELHSSDKERREMMEAAIINIIHDIIVSVMNMLQHPASSKRLLATA